MMREELKRRIAEVQDFIQDAKYSNRYDRVEELEKMLERLEQLFKDLDY